MCDFPSWIEDDEGKAYFLTDKDAERMIADGTISDWHEAVGHSAIKKIYDGGGLNCERVNIHPDVLQAIRRGDMSRLAKASGYDSVFISGSHTVKEGNCLCLGHSRVVARESSSVVARGSSRVEDHRNK